MSDAFNHKLHPWKGQSPVQGAGNRNIEAPGKAENFCWQSRASAPTQYENDLADALEQAYESGAKAADELVSCLNDLDLKTQSGFPWTVQLLESEMAILGH